MGVRQVAVIGAGEVGTTLCLLIDRLRATSLLKNDISVVLLELSAIEQLGAKITANIFHETGYEYFKPADIDTARLCIEGAITKRLLFPPGFHNSQVSNRFFVSRASHATGRVPLQQFSENAEALKQHYSRLYDSIKVRRGWASDEACHRLGRRPFELGWKLHPSEYCGVEDVSGGYASAGGSVNMALDFALKQSGLDQAAQSGTLKARIRNTRVAGIRQLRDQLVVLTDNGEIPADVVVCSAAQNIPALAAMAGGSAPRGTYYLNGMLYVELPATGASDQIARTSAVNFVLQAEDGCMFACLLPPSAEDAGIAALYYPDGRGNQLAQFASGGEQARLPEWWQEAMQNNTVADIDTRLDRILRQAYRFNPFLESYVRPIRMTVRTVFSPDVAGNPGGRDRRVRRMLAAQPVTAAGRVVAMTSPKWTTTELASLTLLQHIMAQLGEPSLPTDEQGLGPLKLDVASISEKLHFHDLKFPRQYALDYTRVMHFPARMVPLKHSSFFPAQ